MNDRKLTVHQRLYYAWQLTRRMAGDNPDLLTPSLAGSQIDLNPHQIEAALFACRNPLAKGVILADEVGLGKTIEAGLVISQCWAERRRRITEPTSQPQVVDRVKKPRVAPDQGRLFVEDKA